jgi:hypothetical protein
VITGVPREDVVLHNSCRQALAALHETPELLDDSPVSRDLHASRWWNTPRWRAPGQVLA